MSRSTRHHESRVDIRSGNRRVRSGDRQRNNEYPRSESPPWKAGRKQGRGPVAHVYGLNLCYWLHQPKVAPSASTGGRYGLSDVLEKDIEPWKATGNQDGSEEFLQRTEIRAPATGKRSSRRPLSGIEPVSSRTDRPHRKSRSEIARPLSHLDEGPGRLGALNPDEVKDLAPAPSAAATEATRCSRSNILASSHALRIGCFIVGEFRLLLRRQFSK